MVGGQRGELAYRGWGSQGEGRRGRRRLPTLYCHHPQTDSALIKTGSGKGHKNLSSIGGGGGRHKQYFCKLAFLRSSNDDKVTATFASDKP